MRTHHYKTFALLALEAMRVCGRTIPPSQKMRVGNSTGNSTMAPMANGASRGAYPFNQLVVFGDQLSDNGAGSFAHGLDPTNIYGHHTWTDGPVAVQYLAESLGVPLLDFAWGGKDGGGLAGPTVDNTYTPAKDTFNGAPVPSTQQQIFDNYTKHGRPSNIAKSLQLIWVGQNDVKRHTNWYAPPNKITPSNTKNAEFIRDFTSHLLPQVEHLIQLGAPGVVVLSIFPLHKAPENAFYFCKGNAQCAQRWGTVIEAANKHLQASLAASKYADKIIYYDVYEYMMHMMENKDSFGFTESLSFLCDGGGGNKLPVEHWTTCTKDHPTWGAARPFFWFTAGQPETHVHQFIGEDIKKTIDAHFRV